MNKATEHQLAALHGKLAETMTTALHQSDRAGALLVEFKEELPNKVRKFLEDAREVNPSLLSSVTKFLKDNNISCDGAEDENLANLEARLKAKKKSNVTTIPFD